MKKVTLKLTEQEIDSIWSKTNSKTLEFFRLLECYDEDGVFTHYGCEIQDADKFREFLNDEIDKCFQIFKCRTYWRCEGSLHIKQFYLMVRDRLNLFVLILDKDPRIRLFARWIHVRNYQDFH